MSAITRIDLPSAWHGAAMARHGRRPSPAPSTPATRPVRFSRITNHETRNTAFMLFTKHESRLFWPPGRCFPARHGAAMARHGRPPSPAPTTRPVGFSPATNHATCFSPVLRRLQGEQPQARPTGFSRNTNHETRNTAFMLLSLLSCALRRGIGRLWCGMGGRRPPRRQHGLLAFHQHESRNMFFPCPPATPRRAAPSPAYGVFTKHESRDTNHGFYAFLPTISHNFPRFPVISRPPPTRSRVRVPSAVLAGSPR